MDRRTLLQAGLALPTLAIPRFAGAQKGVHAARHDAFYAALDSKPWLRPFIGARQVQTRTVMQTVHGRIPEGLSGALYRNGPAFHDLGAERFAHWFDAPGLMQKYAFLGDRVEHRGRLIATPRNQAEVTAGEIQFTAFGTGDPALSSGGSADGQNVGNISVLQHAGELLALWEGGSPAVIDPDTLEAKGLKSWSPETQGLPVSAHSRHDGDGSLWSVGYAPYAGALIIQHISAAGELLAAVPIPMAPVPMIHDFILTPTKLVLVLPPFVSDQPGLDGSFLSTFRWYQDQPVRVQVYEKADLSLAREFELDPFWVFHFGNGYETAGQIVCDFTLHDTPDFMLNDAYAMMDGSWDGHSSTGQTYAQMRLDMATGRAFVERLPELGPAEFLQTNGREDLANHRHTLMLAERGASKAHLATGHNTGFGRLVLYDRQRQDFTHFDATPTEVMEEHLIVPKPDTSDDFWIVGTSLDWAADQTFISVYEGATIDQGPIDRASLAGVLPIGLHGTFIS